MQTGIQGKKQAKDRIFELLCVKHVLTRQDIASELGLSMPTTLQNVTDLLEIGVLRECGSAESNGGRKAQRLCLNGNAGWAIGVDIAVHHTEFAVMVEMYKASASSRCLFKMIQNGTNSLERHCCNFSGTQHPPRCWVRVCPFPALQMVLKSCTRIFSGSLTWGWNAFAAASPVLPFLIMMQTVPAVQRAAQRRTVLFICR